MNKQIRNLTNKIGKKQEVYRTFRTFTYLAIILYATASLLIKGPNFKIWLLNLVVGSLWLISPSIYVFVTKRAETTVRTRQIVGIIYFLMALTNLGSILTKNDFLTHYANDANELASVVYFCTYGTYILLGVCAYLAFLWAKEG